MRSCIIFITFYFPLFFYTTSTHHEIFQVIDGTLVVGERDTSDESDVMVLDATIDSAIGTTSTFYSYDGDAEAIGIVGNVFPPNTLVRCNVGCHDGLLNLTEFCYRVNPPDCIRMESQYKVVYNVTSARWYHDTGQDFNLDVLYTSYSIVY